jgi:hypothetical protein
MDIRKVTIELARPRGNFPGKVETGYYTVADDTVTLVEENGVPVSINISSVRSCLRMAIQGRLLARSCGSAIQRTTATSIARFSIQR